MEKGLHLQNSARRAVPECRKPQKLLEGRRLERLPGCGVLPPAPCHTPAWEIQTLCCFMPEITVTSAPVSFLPLYFLFHSFSLFLSCPSFAFPPCPSLLSLSSLRSSCIYLQRIVFLFPFLVGFLTGVCIGEGGEYAERLSGSLDRQKVRVGLCPPIPALSTKDSQSFIKTSNENDTVCVWGI